MAIMTEVRLSIEGGGHCFPKGDGQLTSKRGRNENFSPIINIKSLRQTYLVFMTQILESIILFTQYM